MDQYQPAHNSMVTIHDVLAVLRRRVWLIFVVFLLSIGTAALVSWRTPPKWRAQSQVILVQRTAPVLPRENQGGGQNMVESVQTQVAMLRSYAMAERTIRWMEDERVRINNQLANPAALSASEIANLRMRGEGLQRVIPRNAAERFMLQERWGKDLSVYAPENTNIISIEVQGRDREQARILADAVCQAFIEWKKQVAQASADETLGTLQIRVDQARTQLREAEEKTLEFKNRYNLVDVSVEAQSQLENYLKTESDYKSAVAELRVLERNVATLGRKLQEANIAIGKGSGVRDDSLVLGLQQRLSQLEVQRAEAELKFRPAYPGEGNLAQLDKQIADTRERLRTALQSTLDVDRPSLSTQAALVDQYSNAQVSLAFARAKVNSLASVAGQAKAATANLPESTMEYARLEREAKLANDLYSSLKARLNAAVIDRESADGNVQISQQAFVPLKPFEPNWVRNMGFGAAVGFLLAFTIVLLLEQGDRRVRSSEDLRGLVDGPVIGALPKWTPVEVQGLLEGNAPGAVEEAYSLAGVNLSLALRQALNGQSSSSIVILVTSAMPGEGKSLTSSQLAKSLARSGNRVTLVDADLRRPTQNSIFGTDEPIGLSDVLAGAIELEQAICATDIQNLTILYSGQPDRYPTELLSSPMLLRTLDALRRRSDYVILDAPASAVVADALILAPHADCILHVVGAGTVDQSVIRDCTAAFSAAGPKVTAFFVNKARHDKSKSYQGYYYYSSANGNTPNTPALITSDDTGTYAEKEKENNV